MFAIYLPGKTGANPEHLAGVGLGDLLAPDDHAPSYTSLHPGPDGGAGVAVHWGGSMARSADFEWTKNPRGNFWFGRSGQLGPADFARRRQLDGRAVIMGDAQEWTIATARQLPQFLSFTSTGKVSANLVPQFKRYYEACWAFWNLVSTPDADQRVTIKWADAAVFIGLALSINYRVNVDVAAWLELMRTDRLFEVPEAACELDLITAALQKKTADAGQSRE